MKTLIATVVGLAAIRVSAQITSTMPHPTTTSSPTMSPVYETIYYDECTTAPPPVPSSATLITKTDTTTTTYCPLCTDHSTASRVAQYTTTYETVLFALCSASGSTSIAPTTYTVTEPCTNTGTAYPSTYVPSGFTVTRTVCTVCGTAPITATLTMPTSCISPSSTAPNAAVSTAPAAPASKPAGAAPQPAHYESNATAPLSSPPVVSPAPSTSPIMPFEGGAATGMTMGLEMLAGVLGVVGVVAFAL